MRFLITGATGFVGANLVRYLLNLNHEVIIITKETSNYWRLDDVIHKVKVCHGDLADREGCFKIVADTKPDIIYHVATYGGFANQVDTDRMIHSNIVATMNMLDAAVENGVQQFINTGSSSEYGTKNEAMKEVDVCEPINFYGVTKLAATNYCTMIGKTLGYSVCTLRLFSPYGQFEDSSRLYPSITNALLGGERAQLSNPDFVRDFIPIETVCKIYTEILMAKYKPGDIVNVGSGKQQTIRKFYHHIASSFGLDLEPIWGKTPARKNEAQKWEADTSKLKSLINIDFE